MAKRSKKRTWIFPLILVVYAAAFLAAVNYGLSWFWDYIDAYEQTRPHIALNAYTEALTKEYALNASIALVDQIDHNVQSEAACKKALLDALQEPLTCAKNPRKSTEDKHVYAILCGKKLIGTMEMERTGEQIMGFTSWVVTKDSFDLSYLLTEPVTVTVPSTFTVSVNGNVLNGDSITQDNIPYPQLAEFYKTYSLPHMVTYQAGPFLGEPEVILTDPAGNVVSAEDLTDPSAYISNCSEAEISALDGLYWISDRGATLSSLTVHHYVSVGDGRYLCDLTYVVDTKNFAGDVQSTSNLKVFFVETENGLKAESMLSY